MTTTHSAPGKIYLFSEHATVAQSNQTDQVKNNGNRNDGSKINSQTTLGAIDEISIQRIKEEEIIR